MTIYGFDTETDHDEKSAWVCQWVLHDGKNVRKGINLDSFKSCLLSLPKGKHYIYIHNLKYDLEFIKYTLKEIEIEQDATMRVIMRKKNPVSIMLEWNEKRLYFRDSMKKWQGSLRSMGEAYGVPKLEAPDEDFTAGWSKRTDFSDPENWRYVIRDAEIVAVAMQQMHKAGFKKATTSGDAWYCMHRMVNGAQWIPGNDKWSKLFPAIPYELDAQLRPAYFGGINISNRRGRIEGPITHEDKVSMYPGVLYYDSLPFGNPVCIDDQLPEEGQLYIIKVCIKFRIKEGHIPWLQFKQGIDYVLEGNRLRYGEPVDYTDSWHEMTLCNVDLENMKEDYDIEFMGEYRTKCWVFKQQTGILRPYIDQFIAQKKAAAKGSAERAHAKRMLNAAYGRFALIQESEIVILDTDEDGDLSWWSTLTVSPNDGYLPLAIFTTAYARRHLMDRVREVAAVLQAREAAEGNIINGFDRIIHSDTDSVIYQGEPIGGTGKDLGMWDLESRPSYIYEGGFKRYIEVLGDELDSMQNFSMACAGVPQSLTFDGVPKGMWLELLDDPQIITQHHVLGQESYRVKSPWLRRIIANSGRNPDRMNTLKLIPVKVPGGVILQGRQHELSDGLNIRLFRCL